MSESHANFRKRAERDHKDQLRHHTDGAVHGDDTEDAAAIAAAVHAHERNDHPGSPLTKLKRGGGVDGCMAPARLDRARGGRTKKAAHHTTVNVITAPPGGGAGGPPPGPPMGPPPMMPPPHPPMGGPPPGGPPPGPPPGPPMGPPAGAGAPMGMPRKTGGRVPMDDGAGGGLGRLEKIKAYGGKKASENAGFTGDGENKPLKRGGRA